MAKIKRNICIVYGIVKAAYIMRKEATETSKQHISGGLGSAARHHQPLGIINALTLQRLKQLY